MKLANHKGNILSSLLIRVNCILSKLRKTCRSIVMITLNLWIFAAKKGLLFKRTNSQRTEFQMYSCFCYFLRLGCFSFRLFDTTLELEIHWLWEKSDWFHLNFHPAKKTSFELLHIDSFVSNGDLNLKYQQLLEQKNLVKKQGDKF